jgi:hypothetical protein
MKPDPPPTTRSFNLSERFKTVAAIAAIVTMMIAVSTFGLNLYDRLHKNPQLPNQIPKQTPVPSQSSTQDAESPEQQIKPAPPATGFVNTYRPLTQFKRWQRNPPPLNHRRLWKRFSRPTLLNNSRLNLAL